MVSVRVDCCSAKFTATAYSQTILELFHLGAHGAQVFDGRSDSI